MDLRTGHHGKISFGRDSFHPGPNFLKADKIGDAVERVPTKFWRGVWPQTAGQGGLEVFGCSALPVSEAKGGNSPVVDWIESHGVFTPLQLA